jgi:hypothetical protein
MTSSAAAACDQLVPPPAIQVVESIETILLTLNFSLRARFTINSDPSIMSGKEWMSAAVLEVGTSRLTLGVPLIDRTN